MDTLITKRQARDSLGVNDAGLSRFFKVTHSAVSQWADDDPLPDARQWQLRAQRPDLFPLPSGDVQDQRAA